MNKGDLISRVSVDTGLSKRDATDAVEAIFGAVQTAVARGEKVSIPGFGTFEARNRGARTGRNPQTGETIKVKATTVPAFKAAQAFKTAVGSGRSGSRSSRGGGRGRSR